MGTPGHLVSDAPAAVVVSVWPSASLGGKIIWSGVLSVCGTQNLTFMHAVKLAYGMILSWGQQLLGSECFTIFREPWSTGPAQVRD